MSNKSTEADKPAISLKNEATKQRWELFHRAIAHAKQSTDAALAEADAGASETRGSGPLLTIVR